MARPSKHLDLKLIDLAKSYMCKGGVSSVSIRRLCKEAGVNLGMFTYLFKSRDQFVERIHRENFDRFLEELHDATRDQDSDPLQALRSAYLKLGEVSLRQKDLILSFIRDGMNGEPTIERIARNFVPEDVILMIELIKKCQKKGVLTADLPPIEIFTVLSSVVLSPVLFGESILEKFRLHLKGLSRTSVDRPHQISRRLDLVLNGLKYYRSESENH